MVTEVSNMDSIKSGNVIVDFYTRTCAPCRALHPVLEEISNEFSNLTVTKVEVTQNPDLSQMFGVMSVPTVIFMKDSKVKHVSQGFSTKENFKSLVRKFYQ
jgi:thioredoxin 1